jgi:hypothetical protein
MLRRYVAVIGLVVCAPDSVMADTSSDLGASWWQWALSIPTAHNPILDTTGADCAQKQDGPIWFLAGVGFGTTTVNRTCTVPASKRIFFPIANQVNFNTPNVCGQGPDDLLVSDMRAASAAFVDGVINMSANLDGHPIPMTGRIRRLVSDVFTLTLPEDNVFDAVCIQAGYSDGVPGGTYKPAVDDGYYVDLGQLSAGSHTLHFHAENPQVPPPIPGGCHRPPDDLQRALTNSQGPRGAYREHLLDSARLRPDRARVLPRVISRARRGTWGAPVSIGV